MANNTPSTVQMGCFAQKAKNGLFALWRACLHVWRTGDNGGDDGDETKSSPGGLGGARNEPRQ
jgi:hypothetical protein